MGVCTYLGNALPPLYTYYDSRISGTRESVYRLSPKSVFSRGVCSHSSLHVPLAIHKPGRASGDEAKFLEVNLHTQCWVFGLVALIPETSRNRIRVQDR